MSTIYLAAGCFWGAEHFLKLISGVVETEVGFTGGHVAHPTYKEVYTDTTGHAETVRVCYDPDRLPLRELLGFYFMTIDPTSLNRQGEDSGTRYRTGIYYTDAADRPVIDAVMAEQAARYDAPLQVEVQPFTQFYPAEEYHQDYLDKNPTGYCHLSPALFELARRGRKPTDADKQK